MLRGRTMFALYLVFIIAALGLMIMAGVLHR